MFVHTRYFVILLAAVLGLAGCQGPQQPSPSGQGDKKVLARVNGSPLTAEDTAYRHQEGHADRPLYGNKSIDDAIDQELLYQQGLKLGLDKDPSYRSKLAKLNSLPSAAKRLEMARRVFNTQIASTIDVRYQDGKDYFDKNADRIATELHLFMVKFEKRQDAEEAIKKLHGGAKFESVASPVMGDVAVKGRKPWDMGFVKWDMIPVDFVEAIYKLQPGEVSEVLGSQQAGFQIVKLLEKRKSRKVEYPAMQGIVMNRLRDLKLLEAYNQYVEKLRKDAKIEKF